MVGQGPRTILIYDYNKYSTVVTLLGAALREPDESDFSCNTRAYDRSSPLERHNIRTVNVDRRYECSMLCAAERLKLRQLGGWPREVHGVVSFCW